MKSNDYLLNIFMDIDNDKNEIDTLLDQLQKNNTLTKQAIKIDEPLKKEEIEKFVIEKAGELVRESLDLLKELKCNAIASSLTDPEQISALASLTTATTSSLDTLNKLIISEKKNETVIKAKQIELEARKNAPEDNGVKLLVTREDILKQLIKAAQEPKTIDINTLDSAQ